MFILKWIKQLLIDLANNTCSGDCEQGRKPCNCPRRNKCQK